jgi:hypothetical protein
VQLQAEDAGLQEVQADEGADRVEPARLDDPVPRNTAANTGSKLGSVLAVLQDVEPPFPDVRGFARVRPPQ